LEKYPRANLESSPTTVRGSVPAIFEKFIRIVGLAHERIFRLSNIHRAASGLSLTRR
jgi:hypothetical protein